MRDLPPRARVYVVATVAAALLAVLVSAAQYDYAWFDLAAMAFLFGATSAYGSPAGTEMQVSVGFVIGLAAVAVLGPAGACIAGVLGYFSGSRTRRVSVLKRIFNAAQYSLSGLVAGLAFVAAGGPVHRLDAGDFPGVLLATAAAAAVYFLVNNSLVAIVVSMTTGLSIGRVWVANHSPAAVAYLGYGALGLLLAGLYYEFSVLAALLLLAPLIIARTAFANYAQLREAYDSTVRALVQAVETKDYYTRGHSERVSRVTEMVAREWGMREDRVQVIRIAGMLHDVGKLGVPTKVLQKQGKLSEKEFEAIKLHPLRGYEMLCDIDFLAEALTGVYHHHERMDGRGYPMGLTDAEIPEFARIIMVADAFDSMTSTRSYRLAKPVAAAVEELRRWQGTQFDPRVVDCLVQAIERHGWEPHPETFFGEKVTKDGAPIDSPVPVITTRAGLVPVRAADEENEEVGDVGS